MIAHRMSYEPASYDNGLTSNPAPDPQTLIPKKGDLRDGRNWRYIVVSSSWSRLLQLVVLRKLEAIAVRERWVSDWQFGFWGGRSAEQARLLHTFATHATRSSGRAAFTAFVDIAGAYPSVNHARLMGLLAEGGVPPRLWLLLDDWLSKLRMFVKLGGAVSQSFPVGIGVPEGGNVSPLYWDKYVDLVLVMLGERCLLSALECVGQHSVHGTPAAAREALLAALPQLRQTGSPARCVAASGGRLRLAAVDKRLGLWAGDELVLPSCWLADDGALTAHSQDALRQLLQSLVMLLSSQLLVELNYGETKTAALVQLPYNKAKYAVARGALGIVGKDGLPATPLEVRVGGAGTAAVVPWVRKYKHLGMWVCSGGRGAAETHTVQYCVVCGARK